LPASKHFNSKRVKVLVLPLPYSGRLTNFPLDHSAIEQTLKGLNELHVANVRRKPPTTLASDHRDLPEQSRTFFVSGSSSHAGMPNANLRTRLRFVMVERARRACRQKPNKF
jgi:hypothetical protein